MEIAIIQEESCIGCSRCVSDCPFDAIVGAPAFLHKVINADCVGCRLCLKNCPVDCIDIVDVSIDEAEKKDKLKMAKELYQRRVARLIKEQALQLPTSKIQIKSLNQEAVSRAKARRSKTFEISN